MSTVMIIILIAVVVIVAAVLVMLNRGRLRAGGGQSLKRRFGPEYDRAVARHDGDTKAAERDLSERVKRHGHLQRRPLEPAAREQFSARWNLAQERFVDSPRQAVAEADHLIAELRRRAGLPDSGHYEQQLDALSVHHAQHVHGYRRVHRAALDTTGAEESAAGTEEMRAAMVEARELFDDLVAEGHDRRDHSTARSGKHLTEKRSTGINRRGVQHG
ncbi:Secreted protein OS=Streptomyces alboniger OX=132473 GN=CP975_10490 PE=4 SV=1 [Streptomyces alboniger]